MFEEILAVVQHMGLLGAIDRLTGVWQYKLFLAGYYIGTVVLALWFWKRTGSTLSPLKGAIVRTSFISILAAPSFVAMGAAVLSPFLVTLLLGVLFSINDGPGLRLVLVNIPFLLGSWLFVLVSYWVAHRFCRLWSQNLR